MNNKIRKVLAALGIIITLTGLAWISDMDYQHQKELEAHGCDMHRLWLEDTLSRLPENYRRGWPITMKGFMAKCGELE